MKKIGVFICHCGINIAKTVDVETLTEEIKKYPGVIHAENYKYMCSDPGQHLIVQAIKEKKLDAVVVAACSPTLHENTFRNATERGGLNRYTCEMANIREQCSWVHEERKVATKKAGEIIKTIIEKVRFDEALEPILVDVTKRALVIGGGIAGIQAALDIANAGIETILIEKSPSIGGRMAQLSETFPTLDCSQCILTPKMVEVVQNRNIKLMTYSEIEEVTGTVGNFKVKIRQKSTFVDWDKCNGCGECALVCPVLVPNEFEENLTTRTAIYRPFPQAVPNRFTITKLGHPPCRSACPAGVNVQGYIALIRAGKYKEALELEREANPFASVCGRVCNHPCETECARKDVDEPIAIASLKRFIADFGDYPLTQRKPTGEKIAVVGSGPSGLACAYFLARKNYQVTVYEAEDVVGGLLYWGIPEFRLPKGELKKDIDYIKSFGVEIKTGIKVGKDIPLEKLQKENRAVFLGTGAPEELRLNIEGETLQGVLHCVSFLKEINLGRKVTLGKKVVVIGGGNAAIDSARTAQRLGCDVTILYRRSIKEMPANSWEVDEAIKEGVKIEFLVAPNKIIGKERVEAIECIKMELGAPDSTGRRRPIPIPGSEFRIPIDNVIIAISQKPIVDWLGDEYELTKWGTLKVDAETLMTNIAGVFAGGDLVSGPATVIEAVAAGKRAAESIDAFLKGIKFEHKKWPVARPDIEKLKHLPKKARAEMPKIALGERMGFKEVELGFDERTAKDEASRCLNCAICSECLECERVCEPQAINHQMEDKIIDFDVGAIVVTSGYDIYEPEKLKEYGYGTSPDIITSLQFERLLSASGPTAGEVRRPSDGKVPKRVVFIQCAGSRDKENHLEYCSKICCMYTAKHAILYKHRVHDGEPIIFYIDVRTPGKGFEEFYNRATDEGAIYIRGKVSKVYPENGKLIVLGADTLVGKKIEVEADMVVLAMGMVPTRNNEEFIRKLKIQCDANAFLTEAHPKLRPVETNTLGIYIAGAAHGPKDIPETVAQASGAASKAIGILSQPKITFEPLIATVDENLCSGCSVCIGVCPFGAREKDKEKNIAKVIDALCQGCGACCVACPSGASQLRNLHNKAVMEMVTVAVKD
ncbi:MAG: NAD(P)-binding protein [bacterium]